MAGLDGCDIVVFALKSFLGCCSGVGMAVASVSFDVGVHRDVRRMRQVLSRATSCSTGVCGADGAWLTGRCVLVARGGV